MDPNPTPDLPAHDEISGNNSGMADTNPAPSSTPLITPTPIAVTPNNNVPDSVQQPTPLAAANQINSTPRAGFNPPANVASYNTAPTASPVLGVPVVGKPFFSEDETQGSQLKPGPVVKSGFGGKKFLLVGLVAILIVGCGLGYVFAFYLPNRPANVFQTGLDRSGKSLTGLVDKFTAQDKLKQLENSEITATAEAKGAGSSFSGNFDVKLSKTKSDGSLDIKLKSDNQAEKALNLKFLTDLPADKQFPNIYFQITGIKALGLDAFAPSIVAYDGKWISIDSDYLESIASGQAALKNKENITSEEVASLVKIISSTSNEYLLTSDKNKAVLENKSFVGRENIDGISAYHYQVGINKPHAKEYCKVLSERVIASAVARKLANLDDKGVEEQKKDIAKSCNDDVDQSIKDDKTLDMWIDAKYKLIHKIRVYDEHDKTTYTDFGQNYNGGDHISFFVAYHKESSKTDAKFSIDVDTKAFTSKGTLTWVQKEGEGQDIKITFEAKPYSGEVKADKPANAISIKDVLSKLGYETPTTNATAPSGTSTGTVQNKAKDTERQTDIKALHGQVEAYYAQYGFYPSLANLNSASWRSTNLRGLDSEALKDPDGTATTLATSATAKQYGYAPAGCSNNGSECQSYTLSAQLSSGALYTKQSLN